MKKLVMAALVALTALGLSSDISAKRCRGTSCPEVTTSDCCPPPPCCVKVVCKEVKEPATKIVPCPTYTCPDHCDTKGHDYQIQSNFTAEGW
jgi:hypothetical protein